MLDFLYEYFRGAIGFSLIVAGLAVCLGMPREKGRLAFGRLFLAIGMLFSFSALDSVLSLPVDLDNLFYQGLMFLLGMFLLDFALYLFGNERYKGGRKILVLAGLGYELALVLLPLLDYALGLDARRGNIEDSLLRGPIHVFAIEAAYAWPIAASAIAIVIARWKPSDIGRNHPESRRLIAWLIAIAPLLIAILAGLILSLKALYRAGMLVLECLLVSWYVYVARYPHSLSVLRTEIGKEHVRRLRLSDEEVLLVEERLRRVEAEEAATLGEDFSLRKLADLVGMPAYRLSAYFSGNRKTTFPAWKNGLRIEFAKRRLDERPDLTVLDISLEAGYRSKASFNEQFTRIVGMSPSEYRKRNR